MQATSYNGLEAARDYVYRVLRESILNLDLEPATCISTAEIASKFNVSRTPTQNAFTRLAADGLLDVYPQRGTYVSKIDLRKVYESVYMRNIMEQAAIRCFFNSPERDKAIIQLEGNLNQQRFYLEKEEYQTLFSLDKEFHNIIYGLSGMDYSKQMLDAISVDQIRFRQLKLRNKLREVETVEEHMQILNALSNGDVESAVDLNAKHIAKFGEDIDSVNNRSPEFFINWNENLADQFAIERVDIYILKKA